MNEVGAGLGEAAAGSNESTLPFNLNGTGIEDEDSSLLDDDLMEFGDDNTATNQCPVSVQALMTKFQPDWQVVEKRSKKRPRPSTSLATTPNSPPSNSEFSSGPLQQPKQTPRKPLIARLSAMKDGEKVDFKKISSLLVAKLLAGAVSQGAIKKNGVKTKWDGSLSIEATGESQLLELLPLDKLGEWDIIRHPEISNKARGVITSVHQEITMEELKEEAESQVPILKAERLKRRANGNTMVESQSVVITFDAESIPEKITIGFQEHKVRLYVPPALQCYKCRRFGDHIAKFCRSKERCARCGQEHPTKDCQVEKKDYKCVNCKESHSAAYGGCRLRKEAQKVVELTVTQGISKHTARTMVKEGKSFAAAAKGQQALNTMAAAENNKTPAAAAQSSHISSAAMHKTPRRSNTKGKETENKLTQVLTLLTKLIQVLATSAKEQSPELAAIASTAQQILSKEAPTDASESDCSTGTSEDEEEDPDSVNSALLMPTNNVNSESTKKKTKKKKGKKKKKIVDSWAQTEPTPEPTKNSSTNELSSQRQEEIRTIVHKTMTEFINRQRQQTSKTATQSGNSNSEK